MKLSEETQAILKNFSTFGSNLWIKPGNILEIASDKKIIIAKAEIAETFPVEFGIYKLTKFLGVLSLFNDVELDFSNTGYVLVGGNGSSEIRYVGAAKSVLIVPPEKEIVVPDDGVNLSITQNQYSDVVKAANTLSVDDICFVGKDGKTSLTANTVSNDFSDRYTIDLNIPATMNFMINFKLDTLKMIPGDYDIRISKNRVSRWANKNLKVSYIAQSTSSSTIG